MHPWIAEWLKFGDGNLDKHMQRSASRGSGGPFKPPVEDPYRDLIDCEAVMDSCEAKCAELGLIAISRDGPDYSIVLRGGKDLLLFPYR